MLDGAADAASLRLLDSSIKRNTAVIKKLKQITEEQRDGLLDDIRSLNMSKFVSEAVSAICDTKLKSSDVDAAVQVTRAHFTLHHRRIYLVSLLFHRFEVVLVFYAVTLMFGGVGIAGLFSVASEVQGFRSQPYSVPYEDLHPWQRGRRLRQ